MKRSKFTDKMLSGAGVPRRLLFLCLMMLCGAVAYAQKNVTGTVVDATGEAVIGASVKVLGGAGSTGTITDFDGNYTLQNVPENAKLEFSYVGYTTQTIAVAGKTRIDVTLQEDRQLLDEVVVVGYGVQKKSDVTGAMASVSSEELKVRPVNNA